jgi:large subunit ribosomal protein L25
VLKDYQRDRIRDTVTHIDLLEVSLDETIQSQVTIELTGESAGVKQGGVLSHALYMVSLEAKPLEIPQHVEVDVSALGLGDSIRVADLPAIEGVTYLDDPETVVASVMAPQAEVEEEPAEGEEGEAAEGEAADAEGDAEPTAEGDASASDESASTEE